MSQTVTFNAPRLWTCLRASLGRVSTRLGLAGTLLFAAVFLSPQFVDGYVGEDILTANAPGYISLRGGSAWQFMREEFEASIAAGRFCPLAVALTCGVHVCASTAAACHTFVFALLIADLALFYCLLRLWGMEQSLSNLGALFLVLLFQLRFCADPILQFAGLLPTLVGLLLVAMIAFERYLATKRVEWQLASLAIFCSALLTYEIAVTAAPVFVVMARRYRRRWRSALAACHGHSISIVAIAAFALGLRYVYGWSSESPYCPRFDVGSICRATALQAFSAVPASYALLSSHRIDNMWERRLICTWQNWAIFAGAAALTWSYLRQFTQRAGGNSPTIGGRQAAQSASLASLAIAGSMIWTLPGLIPALSPVYQETISLGLGHVAVFFQYFGVAMLAISLVCLAHAKLPRVWPKLVWGIVGFNASIAMLTFDTNQAVAMRVNADFATKSMSLIESACHGRLFEVAPAGATIWSVQPHSWMGGGADRAGGHLTKTLGRVIYGLIGDPTPDWLARRVVAASIPPPTFVMNDLWPNSDWAYVVLGAVDPAENATNDLRDSVGGERADAYPVRRFRLFLTGSYVPRSAWPNQLAIVSVRRDAAGQATPFIAQCIDLAELKVAECSHYGVVLEGAFAQPVDMRLVLVLDAQAVAARRKADPIQAVIQR